MESKTLVKIPDLPQEIIVSILPAKSLLRFKSTSKPWCSLISSKQFIKTHLENLKKNPTSANHRILSVIEESSYEIQHYSLHSLLLEYVTDVKHVDFSINKPVSSFELVGTCNGLVCILINKKEFFLWNPTTREFKKLPNMNVSIDINERGFGFDESSGDYKVYAVSGGRPTIGHTYSLKTNSWTRIDNALHDGHILGSKTGIFLSSNLHWTITKEKSNSRCDIFSLDLKIDVFGIVEQPTAPAYIEFDPILGIFDGCLSVLYFYSDTGNLDIWVLKQYGVKDSWSKIWQIRDRDNDGKQLWVPPCREISPDDEEVLFNFASRIGMAVYNPKEKRFWDGQITGFREFLNSYVYVESLVPIVSDDEEK